VTVIMVRSHSGTVGIDVTKDGTVVLDDAASESLTYDLAFSALGGGESELTIIVSKIGFPNAIRGALLQLLWVLDFEDIRGTMAFCVECFDVALSRIEDLDDGIREAIEEALRFLKRVGRRERVWPAESEAIQARLRQVFRKLDYEDHGSSAIDTILNGLIMAATSVYCFQREGWGHRGVDEAFMMVDIAIDHATSAVAYASMGPIKWDEARVAEGRRQIHRLAEIIAERQGLAP